MKQLVRSCSFAWTGLRHAFRHERNIRWHLLAMVVVLGGAIWIRLPAHGWPALCLAVALVVALELVNTALERTLDLVEPRLSEQVRAIKNILAAAVAIAALGAAAVAAFTVAAYF